MFFSNVSIDITHEDSTATGTTTSCWQSGLFGTLDWVGSLPKV